MWSLSKSRRRHDRWEIALAKWGPKAASKCWRNGIHISLPLLPGDRPLSFFYWILTTHYTSIFRPEQHICIYTEDPFIFAFHEEKKNRGANSFYIKMWFINLFFWGKTKLVWTKAEVRPERKSTQFLCCGKCQRSLLFLRQTAAASLTHYWLSWNPLWCKPTKLMWDMEFHCCCHCQW